MPSSIKDSETIDDRSVVVSDKVVFVCDAEGIPLPDITWFKDGAVLDPRDLSNIRYNVMYNIPEYLYL